MSNLYWLLCGMGFLVGASELVGLAQGQIPLDGTLAISLLPFVAAAFAVASVMLRPVSLSRGELRIPWVGTKIIRLEDVIGVGLVCRRSPWSRNPMGWDLEVWEAAGRRTRLYRFRVVNDQLTIVRPPRRRADSSFDFSWPADQPLPHEDAAMLSATRAGALAEEIHERVLLAQGPGGPLSTMALEKHVQGEPSCSPGGRRIGRWVVRRRLPTGTGRPPERRASG